MKIIIGGLVGWYVTSQLICMPQSVGSTTTYPCGQITPLIGPLSLQGTLGAIGGVVLGAIM